MQTSLPRCSQCARAARVAQSQPRFVVRAAGPQQGQPAAEATVSTSSSSAADAQPVVREFRSLGSKVVEQNVAFKGPEDQEDFWEGEKFEAFGKTLENYFLPGLIALGLVCGGIAASSYNEGATTFVKTPTGPDAEATIIIATPETLSSPSISN